MGRSHCTGGALAVAERARGDGGPTGTREEAGTSRALGPPPLSVGIRFLRAPLLKMHLLQPLGFPEHFIKMQMSLKGHPKPLLANGIN